MKLYKISFELQSPVITALKGDTIWGHFVWGIANHEGDESVSKFLEECKTDNPPLIVSSAFPSDSLCLPIPQPAARKKGMTKQEYSQIKQNKKRKYVSASDYFENFSEKQELGNIFSTSVSMHNSINRISNTVEEGNLFAVKENWTKKEDSLFDIYILSSYSKERIIELTQWAFENGFGADTSTGRGIINVHVDSLKEVTTSKNGNKYVALGPFVCSNSVIKNLRSDIYIRTGKIGGAFANSISPFKKTVILYDEGAVFESETPIQFVGELITDIHSDTRICQSGFTPVIPIGE